MDIFVARQPIFSSDHTLYGYEFLYRGSAENQFDPNMDGSVATRLLLSNLTTEFKLDALTGGTFAFVNFTRELLDDECPRLVNPSDFIIEILENVRSDPSILKKLQKLKELGYTLALDDYTGTSAQEDLAELADIIKVDFRLTSAEAQWQIAQRYVPDKCLLAEKIETAEELEHAKANGYSLFQGFYFSRPIILTKRAAELASATYARLWSEIHRPEPDFDVLEQIVRVDVNLSYKLLSRANASAFYRGHRVRSIKVALIQMGLDEVLRWSLSILMRDVTSDLGDEPAKRSLIRALFCQGLVVAAGLEDQREDAYLVGLFSTIDLILGGGLEELLRNLHLSPEVHKALLKGEGPLGDLIRFVRNYEIGSWQSVPSFLNQYGLVDGNLSGIYLHAVEQAECLFGSGKAG